MPAKKKETINDFDAYDAAVKEFDQIITNQAAKLHQIKTDNGARKSAFTGLKIDGLQYGLEVRLVEAAYRKKLSRLRRKSANK